MTTQPHITSTRQVLALPCIVSADEVAHVYRATLLEPSPKPCVLPLCMDACVMISEEQDECLCGSEPHRHFYYQSVCPGQAVWKGGA